MNKDISNMNDFINLFYSVVKNFSDSRVITHKFIVNKKYANELFNTCKLISYRNHINIHDALFSFLSNGEITRVNRLYRENNIL